MKPIMRSLGFSSMAAFVGLGAIATVAQSQQPLFVAYPDNGHETTASQIFLIGSAPPEGTVTVNGQPIERSSAGHFAPSFPLELGENRFTIRYQDQELIWSVTRTSVAPPVPEGVAFAADSLTPAVDMARLPGELVCFEAIAPANATVSVAIANQTIPLLPQANVTTLPPNSAVLTAQNQPITFDATNYQGCTALTQLGDLGQPQYQLTLNGQTIRQPAPGRITILSPTQLPVVQVTANSGAARTGPSTDYSRLTPLPMGTRSAVTGRDGDWLRLEYGAWILQSETQDILNAVPPRTLIRSVRSHQVDGWTEILFPLQVPVPISLVQGDRTVTLTLYNTTAQTDTIYVDDPLIDRFDWQQLVPGQVQYTVNLESEYQWGYKLRYEGSTLILSLRHPPAPTLAGNRILLDPGHGGPEDLGARGPTGLPEKDVTLTISLLLRDELVRRGATVYMTRETDVDRTLRQRFDQIHQLEPTIALSLHYNALPDEGDAINTAGVATFWYIPQSRDLAEFLHDYLVQQGDRPSYGVLWNTLALTRPAVAPSVMLELGFMINPVEFEWIADPDEQRRLAILLADGIEEWLQTRR